MGAAGRREGRRPQSSSGAERPEGGRSSSVQLARLVTALLARATRASTVTVVSGPGARTWRVTTPKSPTNLAEKKERNMRAVDG
jgi:hypothetical protein